VGAETKPVTVGFGPDIPAWLVGDHAAEYVKAGPHEWLGELLEPLEERHE
jgi:hypothetical protein